MTVDSSVAECGESGNVLQHSSQQVTEVDGSTPSLLSPTETAIPLKLCPFCGGTAYLKSEIRSPYHGSDKYGYVASIKHDCTRGIRSHALKLFYSDKHDDDTVRLYTFMKESLVDAWNNRPLDKAVDEKYKQMQEKLHNYDSCVATIYSLAKPLRESNGVCGAIAEFIETYAPKAVENSQKEKAHD